MLTNRAKGSETRGTAPRTMWSLAARALSVVYCLSSTPADSSFDGSLMQQTAPKSLGIADDRQLNR